MVSELDIIVQGGHTLQNWIEYPLSALPEKGKSPCCGCLAVVFSFWSGQFTHHFTNKCVDPCFDYISLQSVKPTRAKTEERVITTATKTTPSACVVLSSWTHFVRLESVLPVRI